MTTQQQVDDLKISAIALQKFMESGEAANEYISAVRESGMEFADFVMAIMNTAAFLYGVCEGVGLDVDQALQFMVDEAQARCDENEGD